MSSQNQGELVVDCKAAKQSDELLRLRPHQFVPCKEVGQGVKHDESRPQFGDAALNLSPQAGRVDDVALVGGGKNGVFAGERPQVKLAV